MLGTPILPLVRIVHFLYLSGPFDRVEPILDELREAVEMETATYPDPGQMLRPYLPHLRLLEELKSPGSLALPDIVDENDEKMDRFEAIELLMGQRILEQELETINSLLCGPRGCTLCCVGPDEEMDQEFFEIPLSVPETARFDCPVIDTAESRGKDLYASGPGSSEAVISHWQRGWSLVMPKGTRCPNLDAASGGCRIYAERPQVCRKPQIFSYLLEARPEHTRDGRETFVARRKLLAIWDCPYVRELQDQIGAYAQLCGLEPVFARNKG
ncbi:MAG: YkgJ family cysteine cluster protein [Thermodesulfobacteriota bacterium]